MTRAYCKGRTTVSRLKSPIIREVLREARGSFWHMWHTTGTSRSCGAGTLGRVGPRCPSVRSWAIVKRVATLMTGLWLFALQACSSDGVGSPAGTDGGDTGGGASSGGT